MGDMLHIKLLSTGVSSYTRITNTYFNMNCIVAMILYKSLLYSESAKFEHFHALMVSVEHVDSNHVDRLIEILDFQHLPHSLLR